MRRIQFAASKQIAEGSTIRGGVSRTDLEHAAVFEGNAYDAMPRDARVPDLEQRDYDDRVVIHAVDEISGAQCCDRQLAVWRGDRCVGRCADRALTRGPLPNAVGTSDV